MTRWIALLALLWTVPAWGAPTDSFPLVVEAQSTGWFIPLDPDVGAAVVIRNGWIIIATNALGHFDLLHVAPSAQAAEIPVTGGRALRMFLPPGQVFEAERLPEGLWIHPGEHPCAEVPTLHLRELAEGPRIVIEVPNPIATLTVFDPKDGAPLWLGLLGGHVTSVGSISPIDSAEFDVLPSLFGVAIRPTITSVVLAPTESGFYLQDAPPPHKV